MTPAALNRRHLLLGSAALAALAACSPDQTAVQGGPVGQDPTLVTTQYGPIQGVMADDVVEFRGVRYAQPPLGPLRFQAPKTLTPWSEQGGGTVPATQYGAAAVQLRAGAGAASYPPLVQAAMTEAFAPPDGLAPEGDEDCLFLNVYTRAAGVAAGATRPVMVWLHGGGYSYGQAALNIYRGDSLARNHDVVVVGVNHRLNIFGFLGLDSLGVPGFEGSANAGMLDIVMALKWVRDNIAMFGGDPSNVTIFGQSGGGGKVSTLLAMPEAKGLFHKAIVQSGAGLRVGSREDAEFTATDFLTRTGIAASIAAEQLPTLSTADILGIAREMGASNFRPSIDGVHIPRHPFEPDAAEQSSEVPVMVGFTKDEQTLYSVGNADWLTTTEAQVVAAAERVAPGAGRALVDAFKAEFPDYSPAYLLMQVTGTARHLRSSHTLAALKSAQPAPVYAFIFAHDLPPQDFVLKSPHTAEIPYIMDKVAAAPLFAGTTDADFAVGRMMSGAWVNFARTGDPNGAPGLPQWPRFDPAQRTTMFLSAASEARTNPFPDVWSILQAAPAPITPG